MIAPWQEAAHQADTWKSSGDGAREMSSRRDAVAYGLAEAVRRPEREALAWLASAGLEAQVERIVELERQSEHPSHNLVAIDLANVLGRVDLSKYLLERSPELRPALWVEYRKALLALIGAQPYRLPAKLSAKGLLATFVPHLALAQTLSLDEDPGPALAAVDEAFLRRNTDKRLFDPAALDGDGNVPVTWDLRKRSILGAAGRRDA